MPESSGQKRPKLDPERYARLKAEADAPYRGLRRFVYGSFAASGAIGAFIFLTDLAAGDSAREVLPNLAIQFGVVALMGLFWRLENQAERKAERKGK